MVGLGRFEPPTSPLSGVRSNQLSYRPSGAGRQEGRPKSKHSKQVTCEGTRDDDQRSSSLKEVIQPHVPVRLPCYDFTPVIDHTVVSALLTVRLLASGVTDSHGVTGGVYKARERIHRSLLFCDY